LLILRIEQEIFKKKFLGNIVNLAYGSGDILTKFPRNLRYFLGDLKKIVYRTGDLLTIFPRN
jgi:hypothetical protein